MIVTNKQGQTFEATADVVVENPEDLQAALNARWRGMLAALAKKDIEGAASFVATRKRDALRHDWTVLAEHLLGEIANLFSVPLQLTDGEGFRVVAKSADPLPIGRIGFHVRGGVCVGNRSPMVYQKFLEPGFSHIPFLSENELRRSCV